MTLTLEESIYAKLSTTSGVTALVSTRIYPDVIPQDIAMPAVAYQRITAVREMAHDGPSGLASVRVQFTIAAASYSSAKAIAAVIRTTLDGFSGTMGSGGCTVEGAFVENDYDGYNQEGGEYVVRVDVMFLFKE